MIEGIIVSAYRVNQVFGKKPSFCPAGHMELAQPSVPPLRGQQKESTMLWSFCWIIDALLKKYRYESHIISAIIFFAVFTR